MKHLGNDLFSASLLRAIEFHPLTKLTIHVHRARTNWKPGDETGQCTSYHVCKAVCNPSTSTIWGCFAERGTFFMLCVRGCGKRLTGEERGIRIQFQFFLQKLSFLFSAWKVIDSPYFLFILPQTTQKQSDRKLSPLVTSPIHVKNYEGMDEFQAHRIRTAKEKRSIFKSSNHIQDRFSLAH